MMTKKMLLIVGGAVLLMVAVAVLALSGSKTSKVQVADKRAGATQVVIDGKGFSPNSVTIKTGTKVTWTNKDSSNHAIISGTASDKNYIGGLIIKPNNTYTYTFTTAGTYQYRSIYNAAFNGTVVVND